MRVKVITGVTGDQDIGKCSLRTVRVGGTANLVGAITVKTSAGPVTVETIPIGATPGTERDYDDCSPAGDAGNWIINMANAGDTALIFYT